MPRPNAKNWVNDTLVGPYLNEQTLDEMEADFSLLFDTLDDLKQYINEIRNTPLEGGGNIHWGQTEANRLIWDGRFMLIPTSPDESSDGYIDLYFPSGAVNDSSGTNRRTSNGILLNNADTLWVKRTRGGNANAGITWHVRGYNQCGDMFSAPDTYLICSRNSDNAYLHFRSGLVLKPAQSSAWGAPPKIDGADIGSGTISVDRIGTGTKNSNTYYRGDGTFGIPAGGGDASASLVNEARNTPMTGGGTITWGYPEGSRLKWSYRFVLLPTSSDASTTNHVTINYPASVLDFSGVERRNSNGILLYDWDALWVRKTRDTDQDTGITLHVRSYQDSGPYYDDDEMYLIAVKNGDNGRLYLRNGLVLAGGQSSDGGSTPGLMASAIGYEGSTNTTAGNVEAALDELDAEKVKKSGDTMQGNLQFSSQLQAGANRPGPKVGFEFLLASDQAGLYAQELAVDHTDYVFYLNDNPDATTVDRFVFAGTSWMQQPEAVTGRKSLLNILEMQGLGQAVLNSPLAMNGALNLRINRLLDFKIPSGTTSDTTSSLTVLRNGQATANVNLNGSTLVLTPTVTGFTGTLPRYYRVTITGTGSPNTFKWSAQGGAETTGVAVGTGPITLDTGVTIAFNSTTGGVVNETFEFWVLPAGRVQHNGTDVIKSDGYLNPARIGTGTRDGTKYLRDDGTWQAVAGSSAASGISYAGSTNLVAATVEAALDELDAEKQAVLTVYDESTALAAAAKLRFIGAGVSVTYNSTEGSWDVSISGGSGTVSGAASDITYAGSTNLSSTNVEAALDELDTEKASATALTNHTGAASGAHAATAISYAGSADLAAATVEAALDELDAEKNRKTPAATPATSSRTLLTTEEYVRATGAITLTLPDASTAHPNGYILHNVDGALKTLAAAAGDNINGLSTLTSDTPNDVVQIRPADANTWGIIVPAGGVDGGGTISVAPGTGVTSATLASGSNARSGRVTVVNGGALLTNALIFTFTFALPAAPKGVFIKGGNVPGARVDWNVYGDFSTLSATTAQIRIVDDGLVANTTYEFYYQIVG